MGDKNFEKGYRDGEDDQSSGEGKSVFWRPVSRLLKPDQILPGAENRFGQYIEGYGKGFEDSARSYNSKHSKQQTTSQGATQMSGSSPQSLANQLGWCVTSRDYLTNLQGEIKYLGREYYNHIEQLRGCHYLDEPLRKLRPLMLAFVQAADEVVKHIENEHLAYIKAKAKDVSEKLEKYS